MRILEYAFARGLMIALRSLSYPAALRLSRAAAHAFYRFAAAPRELALKNLRLAYGDELDENRANEIARGVFKTLFQQVVEAAHVSNEGTRGLRLENVAVIREAHAKGRGVVMVSAHMGCFLRMITIPRKLGIPASVIMKTQQNRRLLQWATRYLKQHFDLDVIHKKTSRTQIAEVLGEGRVVVFFADQHPRKGGFPALFFGRRILAPRGPAIYAKRMGSPLVVLTSIIADDGTNVLRFEGPVSTTQSHEKISQDWVRILEQRIREYPEQWTWMHRRWRHEHLGELDAAAAEKWMASGSPA